MKKLAYVLAPLALGLSIPAAAQDDGGEAGAEAFAQMMQAAFQAEPLTAEEEARLPLASELMWKVMPEGSYAQMMQEVFGGIFEPIQAMMPKTMPAGEIAVLLGMSSDDVAALPESEQARIATLLDPAYRERTGLGMTYMMERMGEMIAAVEPGMRDGLSRAYARRFNDAQLADIQAFFATPTGALYARESMQVFTDPQVMQASMEMLPAMMQNMPEMMAGMEEASAGLEQPRGFDDLDAGQRQWLAKSLGISVDQLRQNMADAEAMMAQEDW